MKILLAIALALGASFAHAADSAQNNLMKTCNVEAKDKKGQERKDFMKTCLSDGKKRQQERMRACSAENKGKKGEEFKKAQAECLKK